LFVALATPVSEELKSSRYCCIVGGSVYFLAALFVALATPVSEELKPSRYCCIVGGSVYF